MPIFLTKRGFPYIIANMHKKTLIFTKNLDYSLLNRNLKCVAQAIFELSRILIAKGGGGGKTWQ